MMRLLIAASRRLEQSSSITGAYQPLASETWAAGTSTPTFRRAAAQLQGYSSLWTQHQYSQRGLPSAAATSSCPTTSGTAGSSPSFASAYHPSSAAHKLCGSSRQSAPAAANVPSLVPAWVPSAPRGLIGALQRTAATGPMAGHLLGGTAALRTRSPLGACVASSPRSIMSWADVISQLSNPRQQFTNALIAANIAGFLMQMTFPWFHQKFSLINAYVYYKHEWWRVLTCAFLHTGFIHVAVNMYTLYLLGPMLEQVCGSNRFLAVYMTGAITGGLLQYMLSPIGSSSVGASSALAGLFGAFVIYKYRNKDFVGFDHNDISWVAQVVGMNVLVGVMGGSAIGHWAHLGGLLGGSAAMWLLGPRYVWKHGRKVDQPVVPLPLWLRK